MSLTRHDGVLSTSAAALTSAVARTALAQSAPSAAAMQRADELLRQMTVEEKAMQLSSVYPLALFTTEGTNRGQLEALLRTALGMFPRSA